MSCHHITTLDHPPREMKETLFTRDNQTVLPLLANTKKASLQAVHTSFVNTAIDNMTDNIILNYRPPPISDEEIYLTTFCITCHPNSSSISDTLEYLVYLLLTKLAARPCTLSTLSLLFFWYGSLTVAPYSIKERIKEKKQFA